MEKAGSRSVMQRGRGTGLTAVAAAVLGVLNAGSVLAQQEGENWQGGKGSSGLLLEEITVTARKREESLSDLPLAVSAYSGEALSARGFVDVSSVALVTPNVTFQNNPGFGGASNSAAVRIRGIGSADFTPTTDAGVGIYLDGVYLARSVGAILDIVEFDRVEVLRGPQGTLFGRNTIGGAISIFTKRPDDTFSAKVATTIGTDNWLDLQGSLNLPVSDNLFVRLTAGSFQQDGYVKRSFDGLDLGDDDTTTGRIDFRWNASESLVMDLSLDMTEDDENGPAMGLADIRFGPQTIDPSTPPFVFFNNIAATLGGAVPNPLPPGPPPPECATDLAPISANPLCYDDRYLTGVNGVNQGTAPSYSRNSIWGVSLVIDYEVSDTLELKLTSSYRELDSKFARDGDASPITIAEFVDVLYQEQVSHEVVLNGTAFEDTFKWTTGAYYFKENGFNANPVSFVIASALSGGGFENESIAVFGQGTYSLTEHLDLTAGLRWTEDTRRFLPDQAILTFNPNTAGFLSPPQQFIFQPGTPLLPSVEAKASISEVTPMVNLSYGFSDSNVLYAMFSQGFKSGGFTQRVLPALIPGITCSPVPVECIPGYDPEYVDAYELGFRTASDDNTYRLSGALFYTDYEDLQISTFTSVAPVVDNAGKASIVGFELEGIISPVPNLLIEASLAHLDPKYKQIDAATRVPKTNQFERVSKWTASLAASYDIFMDDMTITPRLDLSYRSKYYNDVFNTPQLAQDAITLVNFSLNGTHESGLSWTLGGINLGDKHYLESGVFGDAFSAYEVLYSRGAQYYLRVGYQF